MVDRDVHDEMEEGNETSRHDTRPSFGVNIGFLGSGARALLLKLPRSSIAVECRTECT